MYLCRRGCVRSLRTSWLLTVNQLLPAGRLLSATWLFLTRRFLGAHCESLSPGHFQGKDEELALDDVAAAELAKIAREPWAFR
jgi:hypothetical protein